MFFYLHEISFEHGCPDWTENPARASGGGIFVWSFSWDCNMLFGPFSCFFHSATKKGSAKSKVYDPDGKYTIIGGKCTINGEKDSLL